MGRPSNAARIAAQQPEVNPLEPIMPTEPVEPSEPTQDSFDPLNPPAMLDDEGNMSPMELLEQEGKHDPNPLAVPATDPEFTPGEINPLDFKTSNATQTTSNLETSEEFVRKEDVQAMIRAALAQDREAQLPRRTNKETAHEIRVWRFNGKFVKGLKDFNYDEDGNKIDEYLKEPIQYIKRFNQNSRENEYFIGLIYEDGTTELVLHGQYMNRRVPLWCKIIERKRQDISYDIGDVEVKKEVDGLQIPTGQFIPQEVRMYKEIITVEIPPVNPSDSPRTLTLI